jgi:HEAT repeat protein
LDTLPVFKPFLDETISMLEKMIYKLLKDPDKFERMFAAQYLAKYNFKESEEFLRKALEDPDPEVVQSVLCHLEKARKMHCQENNHDD